MALNEAGHEIIAVYTQPDRQSGRGRKIISSPVKNAALELGLRVEQPDSLRSAEASETLASMQADVMVVVAYGIILPEQILAIPRFGCINIHASLLPRWRGAAPIQRAIEHGDRETGITIMKMDAGLDTGDILATYPVEIAEQDTAATLHDRLSELGGVAITKVLAKLDTHLRDAQQQDDTLSTYAAKLTRSESDIDWTLDSVEIERKIRAFNPWPLAKTTLDDMQLSIYTASPVAGSSVSKPGSITDVDASGITVQCGKGGLKITRLQRAGRRPMDIGEFLNGTPVETGTQLGQSN